MTSMLDAARATSLAKIRLLREIKQLEHDIRNTVPLMAGNAVTGGIERIRKASEEYAEAAQAQHQVYCEQFANLP